MTKCGFRVNQTAPQLLKIKYKSLYLGNVELPTLVNGKLEVNHRGIQVKVIDANHYNLNTNLRYSAESLRLLPSAPATKGAGIDVLFNLINYLDFLRETTGRLNVTDSDYLIALYNVDNLDNAFWTGSYMVFGNGATQFKPLVSPDVVGHELTHGLVQTMGGLVYQGESGALNESFSDCFGTAYEYWLYKKYNEDTNLNNDIQGVPDWYVGEDFTKTRPYLRNMKEPFLSSHPKQYRGHFWVEPDSAFDKGGVHINSSVSNHLFYLVSKEISVQTAIALWYRVLKRLKPNATFREFSEVLLKVVTVENETIIKNQLVKVLL